MEQEILFRRYIAGQINLRLLGIGTYLLNNGDSCEIPF